MDPRPNPIHGARGPPAPPQPEPPLPDEDSIIYLVGKGPNYKPVIYDILLDKAPVTEAEWNEVGRIYQEQSGEVYRRHGKNIEAWWKDKLLKRQKKLEEGETLEDAEPTLWKIIRAIASQATNEAANDTATVAAAAEEDAVAAQDNSNHFQQQNQEEEEEEEPMADAAVVNGIARRVRVVRWEDQEVTIKEQAAKIRQLESTNQNLVETVGTLVGTNGKLVAKLLATDPDYVSIGIFSFLRLILWYTTHAIYYLFVVSSFSSGRHG